MAKRILFIGAGASFGARELAKVRPPLGPGLLEFLRINVQALKEPVWRSRFVHCGALLEAAQTTLERHKGETNFEKFLPLLESQERAKIHRLVTFVFSDLNSLGVKTDLGFGNAAGGDGYDELIEKLAIGSPDWVVVSLNYDVLFEQALVRKKVPFRYPHFDFADGTTTLADALVVLKPHGSISFFAQAHHVVSYGGPSQEIPMAANLSVRQDGTHSINLPIVYACGANPEEIVGRIAPPGLQHPVMANYAPRKDTDINESSLLSVRADAVSLAAENELLMIGVNPIVDAADDPFCAEFLKGNFSRVTYVSKGEEAGISVRRIFPSAELHLDGLLAFLHKP